MKHGVHVHCRYVVSWCVFYAFYYGIKEAFVYPSFILSFVSMIIQKNYRQIFVEYCEVVCLGKE